MGQINALRVEKKSLIRKHDAETKKLKKQIADLETMVQQQRDAHNEMEIQMIGYRKIKRDLEARLDKTRQWC